MKKIYCKPDCLVVRIIDNPQLVTMSGGFIGGTTGHFDAPRRRRLTNFEDEEEEGW